MYPTFNNTLVSKDNKSAGLVLLNFEKIMETNMLVSKSFTVGLFIKI